MNPYTSQVDPLTIWYGKPSEKIYIPSSRISDKGDAAMGHKTLMKFIENNKDKELAYLLRNNEEGPVYDMELMQRFEIDALFETYSLLLIAILAGYVPPGTG